MNSRMTCDVAIAGLGPAGSLATILLANAELKVTREM